MATEQDTLDKNSYKLCQVVAIEKGVKNRTLKEITEVYQAMQKPALFAGLVKKYEPLDEAGEKLAGESQKVQMNASDCLTKVHKSLEDLFNVTATKDYGNCDAKADVVVNGQVLLTKAPVTYLLFLEKQLNKVRELVETLPTLSPDYDWTKQVNSPLYQTEERLTSRSKKISKAIVKYPATEQHPAQTEMVSEDVLAGYWKAVGLSGAMPLPERQKLLDKVEVLRRAVKFAREEANGATVQTKNVGASLLGWLFS